MYARVAQGDKRASAHSLVGSRRDGGIAEKVVERVVVQRHRPGKAPQWKDDQESDEEQDVTYNAIGASAASIRQPTVITGGDEVDHGSRRRHRSDPEVLDDLPRSGAAILEQGGTLRGVPSEEEEEEDEAEARRDRLRAIQRRRRLENEAQEATHSSEMGHTKSDVEDEDEGSSSYETDTDDEDDDDDTKESSRRTPMLKPVFVAAGSREAVRERMETEALEAAARERKEALAAKRKEESKALLVQAVRRLLLAATARHSPPQLVTTCHNPLPRSGSYLALACIVLYVCALFHCLAGTPRGIRTTRPGHRIC